MNKLNDLKAALAGTRGGYARPLSEQDRTDNYRAQRPGRKLTARQQRRINHQANRAHTSRACLAAAVGS